MNGKDRIVEEVREALNGLFDEPDRESESKTGAAIFSAYGASGTLRRPDSVRA